MSNILGTPSPDVGHNNTSHILGAELALLRNALQIDQQELARRSGIVTNDIQALEQGRMTAFENAETLAAILNRLCGVLGTDSGYLAKHILAKRGKREIGTATRPARLLGWQNYMLAGVLAFVLIFSFALVWFPARFFP